MASRKGLTRFLVLPATIVALGGAVHCSRGQRPPSVVLIVADTLRADHLSCYGHERETSPELDRFAAGSLLFESPRTQAPCTYPSVNTLLTGRYPFDFLGQEDGFMGIPEGVPALAEVLAARGWSTLAVSASPIVRSTPSAQNPRGGFGRGFAVFDESCLWQDAARVTDRALQLVDQAQRPVFLFLHYMDPHDPYRPPPGPGPSFAGEYHGPDWVAAGDPNPIARMLYAGGPEVEVGAADLQHLEDLYDDEIAHLDHHLGVLFRALEGRGLLSESLVIVTADHGEDFLEKGDIKHCHSMTRATVEVPLIMRLPGQTRGRRVHSLARLVDVAPTILDTLGLEAALPATDGTSLVPAMNGGTTDTGSSFSYFYPLFSIEDGRFKLVWNLDTGRHQLYDVAGDPQELKDLYREDHPAARRLQAELERVRDSALARRHQLEENPDQAREMLRQLGYLQ